MREFITSLFIVLMLASCAPSSLQVTKENSLELSYESKKRVIAKNVLEKKEDYFPKLEINQYKVKEKENILLHEYIETDISWEFIYGPIHTLDYIFDGKKTNILYKDNAISFVQLQISKDKHINILLEFSSLNDMAYVYGFSDDAFVTLLQSIKGMVNKKYLLSTSAYVTNETSKPLSKWSVKMLFLQPLVKPSIERRF